MKENFFIKIETIHAQDNGIQENVRNFFKKKFQNMEKKINFTIFHNLSHSICLKMF